MVRQRRPLWRLLSVLTVLALVAAACGDDGEDEEAGGGTTETTEDEAAEAQVGASVDGTFKLGAILPQTGDLAQYGPGMLGAVELAVDDINAAGGVLGGNVELVSDDSATNPDVANTVAERFIGSERVDGVIGAAGSTVTLLGTIAPVTSAGRLECSGSNTAAALSLFEDDGLYFRTAPSDVFQSQLLANTIAADGYSSIAVVNRADDYGQGFADATGEALTEAGADIVASVPVDPGATNVDADVQQVVSADPDAVVLIMFPEEGSRFIAAMAEQGVGPAEMAIYVTDGLASDDLGAAVDPSNPAIVDGIKGTRPGSAEESAAATEFAARLATEKGIDTTTFAPQFYDCTVLLALGAVAADTDDPQAIAEEIVGLTTEGTTCTAFAECRDLLEQGEDIDYEGLSFSALDDLGEPSEGVYELWQFEGPAITVLSTEVVRSEEE